MGIGSAGQLVVSAAAGASNAIYDSVEQKRQQAEAEERLFSAQMLFYIPAQDYEKIARRVASILSFRYQFLIFRLAAGEDGYIKLANFFVHAMQSYAIARLREHKNDVVRALLNAATPPSTDTLNYRDWPTIDFSNFRTKLSRIGTRKTLELDDAANQIVRRCGPAVRALLGGYENYVDPITGQIKNYQAYTIIGALNHALILNTESRIHSGILPSHRQYIALDGNVKYPIILLGQGETTAHLGVNFATRSTDIILEDLHREALKRLRPDFFTHQVCYQLDSEPGPLLIASEIRYPEEKHECPWTPKRQLQWQRKLQDIFTSQRNVRDSDDIEAYNQSASMLGMLQSANHHYLQTKLEDAEEIEGTAFQTLTEVFKHTDNPVLAKQKAAQAAYYTLFSAQEIMYCMNYAKTYDQKYFQKIRRLIEEGNLAIYASRDLPVKETWIYQTSLLKLKDLQTPLQSIQRAQKVYEMNFQILLQTIEDFPHLNFGIKLLERESQLNYRKSRMLKSQINDHLREIQKMVDMGQAIEQYDAQYISRINIAEQYTLIMREIQTIQQVFLEPQETYDHVKLFNDIKICLAKTHFYLDFIEKSILKDPPLPVHSSISPLPDFAALRETWDRNQKRFEDYQQRQIPRAWLQQIQYRALIEEMRAWLTDLVKTKDLLGEIFQSIEYVIDSDDEELKTRVGTFYKRAMLARQFNFLRYLCQITEEKDLSGLYHKAKTLYLCYKSEGAKLTVDQLRQSQSLAASVSSEMPAYEIRTIAQIIKKNKEQLELRVRDDVEIMELAINQAGLIERDAELVYQEIQEIHNKLDSICDNTDKLDNLPEGETPPPQSRFKNLEMLLSYFEEKISIIQNQVLTHGLLPADEHEIFINRLRLDFQQFKTNLKQPENLLLNEMLGIHFLSQMIRNIYLVEFRKFPHLISLSQIKEQLSETQAQIRPENNALPIAQKKSLKLLKKLYKSMLELNTQSHRFQTEPVVYDLSTLNYVQSTLIWSARFNIAEQKWIDRKLAQQSKKFFENSKEHKSPNRMAFSFIVSIVNEHLINKKRDLNRLRKIESALEKINLYPVSLAMFPAEEIHDYEWFLRNKDELSKTLIGKITYLEKELDALILSRKKLLRQALSIYFNEWREKSFAQSASSNQSFFKPLATQAEESVDEAAAQFSVESIASWYESFKKNYEEKTNIKVPKTPEISEETARLIESAIMSPKARGRR